MKKLVKVLFALCLCVGLVACEIESDDGDTPGSFESSQIGGDSNQGGSLQGGSFTNDGSQSGSVQSGSFSSDDGGFSYDGSQLGGNPDGQGSGSGDVVIKIQGN